jgi:outer membrane immunogenic protein
VQLGSVVIGGELELAGTSAGDVLQPGDNFRIEADRDIYIGARLGNAVSP